LPHDLRRLGFICRNPVCGGKHGDDLERRQIASGLVFGRDFRLSCKRAIGFRRLVYVPLHENERVVALKNFVEFHGVVLVESSGRRSEDRARTEHTAPRASTACWGLRKRGWMTPNQAGSSCSFPMARATRVTTSRSPHASVIVANQAAASTTQNPQRTMTIVP